MTRLRPLAAAPATLAFALVAGVALLAAGCGTGDEVAAEVGESRYTVAEFHDHLAAPDDRATAARIDAAGALSRWVFFAAVEMELADRGVVATPEHEARAVTDLTEADPAFVPGSAGGSLRIHQHAVALAAVDWSEAAASELTDPGGAGPLRHLCSSHILVASEAGAEQVVERLDAGEPFGLLAIELSQDPGSGSLGGELGCVVEGSFVAPFEDAAYGARPGDVVVAESQFGFHVIQVTSSGPATAADHPQIDAATLAQMASEAEQAALIRAGTEQQQHQQSLITELQSATAERFADQVSINDRYGYWDPVAFQVVLDPPA